MADFQYMITGVINTQTASMDTYFNVFIESQNKKKSGLLKIF